MFGGLLGKLFGTEKALSGIVDGVTNGLDALVYTDEEKAQDAAKDRTEARQMVVQWMSATQGQNLARRLIALSITGVWLAIWLLGFALNFAAVFWDAAADRLINAGNYAKESAGEMGPAVMLILAFYFAAPHMGDIATAAIGKFKDGMKPDRVG